MKEGLFNLDLSTVQHAVAYSRVHEWFAVLVYFMAEVAVLAIIPVLVWLWYKGRPARFRPSGKKAVVLALLTTVFVLMVKTVVAMVYTRARPFVADPLLSGGSDSASFLDPQSFPSGHVMLIVAVAVSLWQSGYRKFGAFLGAMAAFVVVGRVSAGVHYPSDVIAGIAIGWFIAWFLQRETSSLKDYLPDT